MLTQTRPTKGGRLTDADLDSARDVPFPAIVAGYLELHRSGSATLASCPFHDESSPSFTVYDEHAHCFGCGWHGDGISFLAEIEQIGFPDAVRLILDRHRHGAAVTPQPRRQRPQTAQEAPPPAWVPDAEARSASAVESDLRPHAEHLGLDPLTLLALGAFPSRKSPDALLFPMREKVGGPIVGLRVRRPDWKGCVKGSRNALFIPCDLLGGPLFLPEGPTDAAALIQLGYDAVGRPNANSRAELAAAIAAGRDVVVVSDRDDAGCAGAVRIIRAVTETAAKVRALVPPEPWKDVRAWIVAGATRVDIEAQIIAKGS